MSSTRLSLFLLLLVCAPLQAGPQADFFVAPGGNDAWSGRLAAPNRTRTDGPFAGLARAQQAVRDLRAAEPARTQAVVILVRGGTYFLQEPLTLVPEDSGTRESPTLYAAYPGERPVVSGGMPILGWKRARRGWQAHLPEVRRGEWSFIQLFVNDQRRYRPRLPRDGYFHVETVMPPTSGREGDPPDRFRFPAGTFPAGDVALRDLEVLLFHAWTMDRMRVKEVDYTRRIVTLTSPTLGTSWFFDIHAGQRFLLDNVGPAYLRPGEWYLDTASGTLTYLPLKGERMGRCRVIAPRLTQVLRLKGDPASGLPVAHVLFRGITFAHTNWTVPAEGYRFAQAEVGLWGAVSADGAQDCAFEACEVTHVGTYGLELLSGCQRVRIQDCRITDTGAGGIKLGEMGLRNEPAALTSHNTVRGTLVAHGGRLHPAGVGIWIGQSPYNTIEHNEICDLYYSGLSVGWSWGYGPSQAHHNTIAYNHVYHIGQGVLSDMGGIYTLGVSPGTTIHHNVFHDISCHDYGGRGIYFDEGTTGATAEANIVYRTDTGAFMQHYGRDNVVRNNVFALARGGLLDRLREEEHNSFTFERNIVYGDHRSHFLAENWSNNRFVMDRNLYWNADGQPVQLLGQPFEEWQKRGHDRNSLVADPLFVAPTRGDFRLRRGSPALRLGFVPIDTSKVGRPSRPGLREEPLAPRAFPPRAEPPPVVIREGFEGVAPGEKAPGAVTSEENMVATARVTEETAAAGRRCLKMVDAPGQKFNFNPHLYYPTNLSSGLLRGGFDLRVEPGMSFYHEWRDVTVFYKPGPLVRVRPDGAVVANDKELMKVPLGRWMRFEIACRVGKGATGTWDLVVRVPGLPARRFQRLPHDPGFHAVHWLLFTADGEQAGVCYVDNVRLAPSRR